MNFHFASPAVLSLLLAVPLLAILAKRGAVRRAESSVRFGGTRAHNAPWITLAALICIIIGLARPAVTVADPNAAPRNGDTVFLLDVSRSMLAEDVAPSRLEQAKQLILRLASQIPQERVALVAFAGNQSVECPLTIDATYFEESLSRAGPASVARGGTRIGDAIRFAVNNAFDDVQAARKQVVIVTDGGDHESAPEAAASDAVRQGFQLVIVGVGNERAGGLVPTSLEDRTPVQYHGQPVRTQLDVTALQKLEGQYWSAQEARLTPARSASALKSSVVERGFGIIFAALALLLLLWDKVAWKRPLIAMTLVISLVSNTATPLQAAEDWAQQGLQALRDMSPARAVNAYERALRSSPNKPEFLFNFGVALYESRRYDEAQSAFQKASRAAVKDSTLEAKARMGTGNALYQQAIVDDRQTGLSIESHPVTLVAGAAEYMLTTALREYREVLRIKPGHADAAYNIEVIERRLKAMREASPSDKVDSAKRDPVGVIRARKIVPAAVANVTRQPVEKDW